MGKSLNHWIPENNIIIGEKKMGNEKPALTSTTVWGGIISILPWAIENLPQIFSEIVPIVLAQNASIVSALGGIIAIIGRKRATKKLKGVI